MYLIVLDDSNRIFAARDYLENDEIPENHILVEDMPHTGNMMDWIYNGDGTYTYDPIPIPPEFL